MTDGDEWVFDPDDVIVTTDGPYEYNLPAAFYTVRNRYRDADDGERYYRLVPNDGSTWKTIQAHGVERVFAKQKTPKQ